MKSWKMTVRMWKKKVWVKKRDRDDKQKKGIAGSGPLFFGIYIMGVTSPGQNPEAANW